METPKSKRILWLLNHTTLRDSEIPMLIRLGFEVYIPKIVPSDEANRSASVSHEYDNSLSIPPGLLKLLNQFDFYTRPWPRSLATKINKYFGITIAAIFPKMVNAVCGAFEGDIFLRAFGLAQTETYANVFRKNYSKKTCERIKNGDRIWLATNIATVIDNEPSWLQHKSIYLPVGLPANIYQHGDKWRGEQAKILFVCPRINSSSYYNQIYRNFKRLFGDIPHVIAGAQSEEVWDDPNVTGYVKQEEFVEIFKSCKVMYYHSQEERHLHYHPIEAMIYGMPVIFMSGGVLEFLAKKQLPGCCDTLEKARIKVQRILSGDKDFINEVTMSQKIILKEFETQHVEDRWHENFIPLIRIYDEEKKTVSTEQSSRDLKHIGIWMHETNPNGFTGEGISRLLAMVVRGAQEHSDLQIHIAAVSWVKQAIIDYMEDLGVDTQHLAFVFVDEKPPLIFQLYNWWSTRNPRPRRQWIIFNKLRGFLREFRAELGTRFITLRTGGWLFAIIILAFITLPLIVILGIILLVLRAIKELLDRLIFLLRINRLTSSIMGGLNWVKETLFSLASRAYGRLVHAELMLLAKKVGGDKKFAAWFFAYPNNKFLSYFSSPKIIAVPDIVYMDFPSKYSREAKDLIEVQSFFIKQTVNNADAVITFSEYVRQNHVIKPGYQREENVTVVRHAPIETRSLISPRLGVDDDELRLLARRVIKNYLRKQTQNRSDKDAIYLRSLNLGEIDYLFVSSQSRLHKNHLNLLKAYRFLLRERYINLKLVFTGEFSDEMDEYITEERLHLDVLSMHYMPPVVHASFYTCAKLTVVPTLFEGGFPFVFSESLSVNTPVVLSDIPAVREVFSEEERKLFCFDPYNIQEMAHKIKWALENRSSLLDAQAKTFEQMKMRTWKDVAEEYIRIFIETKKRKDKNESPHPL